MLGEMRGEGGTKGSEGSQKQKSWQRDQGEMKREGERKRVSKFILHRQRSCRCPTGTAAPEERGQQGWADGWTDRRMVPAAPDPHHKNCSKHAAEQGDEITERKCGFAFTCPQVNSLNVTLTEPAPQKKTGFFLLWTPQPRALRAWGWTCFASESCDCLGLAGLELQQLLCVSGRATAASAAPAAVCSPTLTLLECCICFQIHWQTFLN